MFLNFCSFLLQKEAARGDILFLWGKYNAWCLEFVMVLRHKKCVCVLFHLNFLDEFGPCPARNFGNKKSNLILPEKWREKMWNSLHFHPFFSFLGKIAKWPKCYINISSEGRKWSICYGMFCLTPPYYLDFKFQNNAL